MRERFEMLEMQGIGKAFAGIPAISDIGLTLEAGEILGLLGENGAGKSTLMNILFGLHRPDAGRILLNRRPVAIRSPRDARRLGIGMVHQHFMLIPTHTVLENLAPAVPETTFFSPLAAARRKLEFFRDRFHLQVRENAFIWELSAGEQQRVEILKALAADADVLILDEPTSVLTPGEAEELFVVLDKLAAAGCGIILISHKLEEIMRVCRRIQVLRKGVTVGSRRVAETTREELARLMVGRELVPPTANPTVPTGEVVLRVQDVSVTSDRGIPAVQGLSFALHAGEILGVAGVSGNGQKELIEALTGLRPPCRGTVFLREQACRGWDSRRCFREGIAHIPEERVKFGIVSAFSACENAILKEYFAPPFSRNGCLDFRAARERAGRIISDFQVQPADADLPLGGFSGGNMQKFIVGRELASHPAVIIAAHPTYGVDIGSVHLIHRCLLEERARGTAILLISEDLEEIFALSDRIAVMFSGNWPAILPRNEADRGRIGLLMAGSTMPPGASAGTAPGISPGAPLA